MKVRKRSLGKSIQTLQQYGNGRVSSASCRAVEGG